MLKKMFLGLALLASALLPVAAAAQIGPITGYTPNFRYHGYALGSAYTNSTTSATDIPSVTMTLPAMGGDFAKQYIHVCFFADVTKATATTGAISIVIGGVTLTPATRYTSSGAARNSISGCGTVQRAAFTAQIVKLQGVSADTNLFTVTNVEMDVWTITTLSQS